MENFIVSHKWTEFGDETQMGMLYKSCFKFDNEGA